jgi:trk system potassium uptake protein TrkA
MYAIIAGSGRLSSGLARALSMEGHDVVIVAEDIDHERLANEFDGVTVNGSPTDEEVLQKAGISKAQLVVAATADDNINVMVVQMAKEIYRVPLTLARISDPDRETFYRSLGLTTVCPTTTGINQILGMVQGSFFSSLPGSIDVDLIGLKPSTEWIGKKIDEIDVPDGRKLIGTANHGRLAGADHKTVIGRDDTLIFTRNHRS